MNTNIDRTVILNLKTMENVGDKPLVKKYRGVGRSREGVGHKVLSLVQGVGRKIFSYPQGVGHPIFY